MASHSLGIIPLSISKLLERLAYYGMRSILILYMVDQIPFEQDKARSIYQLFIFLAGVLPIIGGLIGDFLLSTRTTAIIGGFIQATGMFILAVPSQITVYIGLFLIALGIGLYNPNIVSSVGNIYKNRLDKLDAAMLILYLAMNLGAFIGALLLILTSNYMGYQTGFILSGIIMIGSQLVLLFSNNLLTELPRTANIYSEEQKSEKNNSTRLLILITTILLVSFCWTIYQSSSIAIYDRYSEIQNFFNSFFIVFEYVNSFSIIFVGMLLIIIFSFLQTSSLIKVFIGFILFAISCAFIGLYGQTEISNSYVIIILFSVFLQAIAELFISPIALSLICKYGSTKYNSTLIGAYISACGIFSSMASYVSIHLKSFNPGMIMFISTFILIVFGIIFLVLYLLTRDRKIIS